MVHTCPEKKEEERKNYLPEFFQGCARLVPLLQRALIDGRNLTTIAGLGGAHDYTARSNLRPVVFGKRPPSSHDNAALPPTAIL